MDFNNIFNEANASVHPAENAEQKLEETKSVEAAKPANETEKLQEATFFATNVNDNGLPFTGFKKPEDKSDIDSFVGRLKF